MSKVERFLKLEEELQTYKKMMGEAAEIILNKDVSDYPIFVIHQQQIELGIPIAEREKIKGNWSVNASSLEEFVSKQIIFEEKIEEFKANYKSPDNFLCLFILSELGAQFVFIPRK